MITPCIQICKIDPQLQRCIGCHRTLEQIAEWSRYTDEQRKAIISKLTL